MRLTVKWYVAAWRLVWFVPATIARALFTIFIFIGWGWRDAVRAWESTS